MEDLRKEKNKKERSGKYGRFEEPLKNGRFDTKQCKKEKTKEI